MGGAAFSFSEEDKDILVVMVKNAQHLNIEGSSGGWKEFLAVRDGPGRLPADPAKRPWQVLADFVQTLQCDEGIQMVERIRKWKMWSLQNEQADMDDPWPDTPEQGLVNLTSHNPRFHFLFKFPSYHKGWIRTKRGASTDATTPERLLSLDCEMVLCENQEYEVVQVCVVDRNFEAVLNTLVKPSKKVVDYLTNIHGITIADLEKATCTQEEAQERVKKLLKPGTILVGHSIHNDLKALKIDHRRVIDTSLIFRPKGASGSVSIGLNGLCKAVLGHSFREEGKAHNCLDDAVVPMKLVLHELQNGLSEEVAVEKVYNIGDPTRLLIHRIPQHLSDEKLKNLISPNIPCVIERVAGKKGQAFAIFPIRTSAEKAFDVLPGEVGQDSSGLPQKMVTHWNGPQHLEFRVRKMVHNSEAHAGSVKRQREEQETDPAAKSKQLKADEEDDFCTNICRCGKAAEVERLKKRLEASNAEIVALKKLIAGFQKS